MEAASAAGGQRLSHPFKTGPTAPTHSAMALRSESNSTELRCGHWRPVHPSALVPSEGAMLGLELPTQCNSSRSARALPRTRQGPAARAREGTEGTENTRGAAVSRRMLLTGGGRPRESSGYNRAVLPGRETAAQGGCQSTSKCRRSPADCCTLTANRRRLPANFRRRIGNGDQPPKTAKITRGLGTKAEEK